MGVVVPSDEFEEAEDEEDEDKDEISSYSSSLVLLVSFLLLASPFENELLSSLMSFSGRRRCWLTTKPLLFEFNNNGWPPPLV